MAGYILYFSVWRKWENTGPKCLTHLLGSSFQCDCMKMICKKLLCNTSVRRVSSSRTAEGRQVTTPIFCLGQALYFLFGLWLERGMNSRLEIQCMTWFCKWSRLVSNDLNVFCGLFTFCMSSDSCLHSHCKEENHGPLSGCQMVREPVVGIVWTWLLSPRSARLWAHWQG